MEVTFVDEDIVDLIIRIKEKERNNLFILIFKVFFYSLVFHCNFLFNFYFQNFFFIQIFFFRIFCNFNFVLVFFALDFSSRYIYKQKAFKVKIKLKKVFKS